MKQTRRRHPGGLCQVVGDLGGFRIYSHSLMNSLGLAVGLAIGNAAVLWTDMAPLEFLFATLVLVFIGFLGARLLHVLSYFPRYRREPRRIWDREEGGMAMQGGLLLVFVASLPILSVIQLPFWVFWDTVTIPALIWLAFGKVGCLLHGCCSGRPSAGIWSFDLPDHRGVWCRRIPVQIFESGLALLVLLGSAAWWSMRPVPGTIFLFGLAAYSAGRVFIQSLREQGGGIGSQSTQKGLSILFLFVAASTLLWVPATNLVTSLMEGPL